MSAHTPGPWTVAGDSRIDAEIVAPDSTHVVCFGHDYDDGGSIGATYPEPWNEDIYNAECMANARLIAAAPDLLAALKEFVDDIEARWDMNSPSTNPGIKQCVEQAKAAIAKAEQG